MFVGGNSCRLLFGLVFGQRADLENIGFCVEKIMGSFSIPNAFVLRGLLVCIALE